MILLLLLMLMIMIEGQATWCSPYHPCFISLLVKTCRFINERMYISLQVLCVHFTKSCVFSPYFSCSFKQFFSVFCCCCFCCLEIQCSATFSMSVELLSRKCKEEEIHITKYPYGVQKVVCFETFGMMLMLPRCLLCLLKLMMMTTIIIMIIMLMRSSSIFFFVCLSQSFSSLLPLPCTLQEKQRSYV